jgi:hypothetical protein
MPSLSREITPVHIGGRSHGASAGASPGSSVEDTATADTRLFLRRERWDRRTRCWVYAHDTM